MLGFPENEKSKLSQVAEEGLLPKPVLKAFSEGSGRRPEVAAFVTSQGTHTSQVSSGEIGRGGGCYV
jgi:hypothetical protein